MSEATVTDRALWFTWYDLPPAGRDQHLAWLHDEYIPKVLERPGVLWAAHYASESNIVPQGGGTGRVIAVQAALGFQQRLGLRQRRA